MNVILTKSSTENQIRAYFLKVLELKQSNEQFPVDLEEVWPLVYGRKDEATRALKSEFIQDVDYQAFRIFAERGAASPIIYKLTLSCMEYFIVRKVQPVFNVYRSVFHQSVESAFQLPQTFSEALRLAADKTEENERLMIESREKDRKIEEQAPAVVFTESVKASVSCITVSQLAKNICQNGVKIGEHRLYDWLVENKYLIRHQRWSKTKGRYISNYEAYQRYIEMGLFFENKTVVNTGDISFTNRTNYITGKGQVYFMNKFLDGSQILFNNNQ